MRISRLSLTGKGWREHGSKCLKLMPIMYESVSIHCLILSFQSNINDHVVQIGKINSKRLSNLFKNHTAGKCVSGRAGIYILTCLTSQNHKACNTSYSKTSRTSIY